MNEEHEIEEYGDPRITSYDNDVPAFLKWSYFLVPLISLIMFILYFNGSWGYLDRGYWRQLQNAAKTTFPIQQFDTPNYDFDKK